MFPGPEIVMNQGRPLVKGADCRADAFVLID